MTENKCEYVKRDILTEQDVLNSIDSGQHEELYPEWARTGTQKVRKELAICGYQLDTLIHDENEEVRYCVMRNRIEYIKTYMPHCLDANELYRAIYHMRDVDADILEYIAEHLPKTVKNMTTITSKRLLAVELKLSASKHQATLLEKIMTQDELYASGSPLWAKDLSLCNIWDAQNAIGVGLSFEDAVKNLYFN